MANNCLITKLNGQVNDNNLPYFNKLSINVSTDFAQSAASTMFIVTGGSKVYPQGITPPDDSHAYYGNYTVFVENKYDITLLQVGKCLTVKTSELKGLVSPLTGLQIGPFIGDISELNLSVNGLFVINSASNSFTLDDVLGVTATGYRLTGCSNLTGKIESFGGKTDITLLNIQDSDLIDGDLFELAKRQINNGRDECSGISMPYLNKNPNLKFNGTTVYNTRKSDNTLSWTYNSSTHTYTVSLSGEIPMSATYIKEV